MTLVLPNRVCQIRLAILNASSVYAVHPLYVAGEFSNARHLLQHEVEEGRLLKELQNAEARSPVARRVDNVAVGLAVVDQNLLVALDAVRHQFAEFGPKLHLD